MKILDINEQTYRKKTNLVMVCFVGLLAILSIIFGAILIALFGASGVTESGSTGNFHLNVFGVILAVIASSLVMNKIKNKPYFSDIMYVWRLKQIHRRIYQKLNKIKVQAEKNDYNSLLILAFYYTTQLQVYTLDNNTLTLDKVQQDLDIITLQAKEMNYTLNVEDFELNLLNSY